MGFEILPWPDGDEETYEIFDITRVERWTPRVFRDEDDNDFNASAANTTATAPHVIEQPLVCEVYDYAVPMSSLYPGPY